MSWVSIDVDLDDVYNEMSRWDKENMAEWLMDDGILNNHPNSKIRETTRNTNESPGEEQYRNDLTKIWNSFYQLSNEDIEIIKNIANKI
jgi:hypothetical protein